MRKLVILLVLLPFVAGGLFAGGQAEVADVEPYDPDEEYTIEVAAFPITDEALGALVDGFNEEYPNIEVEISSQGFDDHHESLVNDLAAGADLPDVVLLEINFIAQFTAAGGFHDLLQEPFNAGEYEDAFIDYKWAQGTTPDGRLVAFPKDIAPASMFYRRDIFEDVGLPGDPNEIEAMIDDWDGFFDVMRRLTRDESGDGDTDHWALVNASELSNIIAEADAQGWFDDDGEPRLNDPYFVEALELASQVREEGLDADVETWTAEWSEAIDRGASAIIMHGAWMGGQIGDWVAPDTAGDWGVTQLPAGMYANDGGSFLSIPQAAAEPAAAWEFIRWVTTNVEPQLQMFEEYDIFPALNAALEDDGFAEDDPVDFYGGQAVRQWWREAAEQVPEVRVNRNDPIADEMFDQAVEDVLLEGADPAARLEEANDQVRRRMTR